MASFPVLSVRQPWTGVCVLGLKDVENRTRRMPEKYIGKTVLLHAGLQLDRNVGSKDRSVMENAFGLTKFLMGKIGKAHYGSTVFQSRIMGNEHVFNTGGIVGYCKFSKCVQNADSPWAERGEGIWHWCIERARPLPFHPCKGRLGFFPVDYPYAVEVKDEQR